MVAVKPAKWKIDIDKKKWNFEIFRIHEVVVNVNLQISGFLERLCE